MLFCQRTVPKVASCHLAANSFSDTVPFSLGIENRLGTRNSPSLANVVYQDKLLEKDRSSVLGDANCGAHSGTQRI
ncbi:MAG: hypothetical protein IPL25_12205 [Saprospiraceae bacterium]|nr:hypothetical protein [Candidatus Vicinibacter affinis]